MNWQWLKHAFAVPPPEATVMTPAQQALVERLCLAIEVRGMQLPALMFLESVRPMNYLTAQSMHFFTPFVAALADPTAYQAIAEFLEQPGAVEILCHRLEHKRLPEHAVQDTREGLGTS